MTWPDVAWLKPTCRRPGPHPRGSCSTNATVADIRWGPSIPGIPVRLHQRGLREILIRADSLECSRGTRGPAHRRARRDDRGVQPARGRGVRPGAWPRKQRVRSLLRRPSGASKPESRSAPSPPFHAIPIQPGDIGTNGGLRTNEHAQVIDERALPIARLYATGNATASMMGHSYPGAGATLGPAMTFGFIAAQHACGRSSPA